MNTYKYPLILLCLLTGCFLFSCKKDDNKPSTYNTDKSALNALIDSATNIYNTSVEGKKAGQYSPGSRSVLDSTIQLATAVSQSNVYTQQEVDNATGNLRRAILKFSTYLIQDVSPEFLIAQWLFNGNAIDSSGHEHDGTLKAGWVGSSAATAMPGTTLPQPVADRYGQQGMAYDFNNAAYVEVPYSKDLNPSSFTLTLWVKRHGTNSNNYIFSLNRWNGFKFQLQSANYPFLTVHTSAGYADVDAGVAVPDETWTQLGASYTNGTMKFYINGGLVKTQSISGALVTLNDPVPISIGNELPKETYSLTDPSSEYAFYGANYFIGSIDDIRFYNTVLSDAEVQSIYTMESP
jgi:hypothetical protein